MRADAASNERLELISRRPKKNFLLLFIYNMFLVAFEYFPGAQLWEQSGFELKSIFIHAEDFRFDYLRMDLLIRLFSLTQVDVE